MIAIPKDHPLAAKEMIDIEDLYGKTLMIMSQGISFVHDKIREDFVKNHPQIHLEDIPHSYDLSVFQRCIDAKNTLLIPECLKNILPDIISLPVHWDYSVPYGILYSLNSSENVLNFINAAKNLLSLSLIHISPHMPYPPYSRQALPEVRYFHIHSKPEQD